MLDIDLKSVIVICLIVWMLVVVLKKIFFNPLAKTLDERDTNVQGNREACQKSIEDYEMTVQEIEERIREAKAMSRAARESIEQDALREKDRLLAEVSTECRNSVEEAKRELEKQMQSLQKEMKSRSERLAERIEKRLLN
jgi:F0F1-type ATP synthase membrane subunit b/b'